MKARSLQAAVLILALATPSLHAGPTFTFDAGPPPGPAGLDGNVSYLGFNDFGGSIFAAAPYGILGASTPLNPGSVLPEYSVSLGVSGVNSGYFDVYNDSAQIDFQGQVITSAVGPTGGGLTFEGTFSPTAAAYFGLSPSTELTGSAAIEFSPASMGTGNEIASIQFTFSPSAVPEPPSLVLLGAGALGLVAFGLRRGVLRGKGPAS